MPKIESSKIRPILHTMFYVHIFSCFLYFGVFSWYKKVRNLFSWVWNWFSSTLQEKTCKHRNMKTKKINAKPWKNEPNKHSVWPMIKWLLSVTFWLLLKFLRCLQWWSLLGWLVRTVSWTALNDSQKTDNRQLKVLRSGVLERRESPVFGRWMSQQKFCQFLNLFQARQVFVGDPQSVTKKLFMFLILKINSGENKISPYHFNRSPPKSNKVCATYNSNICKLPSGNIANIKDC